MSALQRRSSLASLAMLAALALSGPQGASAATEVVAPLAYFPEGPVWHDGALYYVEYSGDKLSKWDGESITTVHEKSGCGHNGLLVVDDAQFIIVCFNSNEVIWTDLNGKELEVVNADAQGRAFDNPNDVAVDANGGVYLTESGPWEAVPSSIAGAVYYRAPGTAEFVEVADDIHFANGLAVSNDGSRLFVAETIGNRIISFAISPDGRLSDRRMFVRLSDLVPDFEDSSIWIGPDGIKFDSQGNLYVTQYEGGRVIVVDPDGNLVRVLTVPAGRGTTNLSFGETEDVVYITGAIDISGPPWIGKVWKVDNK